MTLTPEESKELARLMKKVTFPVTPEVFDAWCEFFTINTVEIALMRNNAAGEREVFLTYRKDNYFDGWHIPGSVIRPGDSVQVVIDRVTKKELEMEISTPTYLRWFEREKGIGKDLCPRGQEISLLFSSELIGEPHEHEHGKFFSFSNLPKLIPQHPVLIDHLKNLK